MFDVRTAKPAVTLADAKLHLRVEHDADDALIEGFVLAATQQAEQICGREIIKREDDNALCESVDTVPAGVSAWVKLKVSDLYEHRAISESGVDAGRRNYDHLLDAFRHFEALR